MVAIIEDDDGYSVLGEIWNVDLYQMYVIDAHEALYHRAEIAVEVDLSPVYGYIYDAWPDHRLIECSCGFWVEDWEQLV